MLTDALTYSFNKISLIANYTDLILKLLLLYAAFLIIYYYHYDQLKYIPGPWWARFTHLPYVFQRILGENDRYSSKLHKKYGSIVRVGPNEISLSNTRDLKIILSSYKYPKSKSYTHAEPRQSNIFTTRSEDFNRMRRRQVGPAFTKVGLDSVEDLVLQVGIKSLQKKINLEIDKGNGCYTMNYYKTFQNLTSDVVAELAFGRSFNAIEKDGFRVVDWVHSSILTSSLKAIFPFLKYFPFVLRKLEKDKLNLIFYTFNAIEKRKKLLETGQYKTDQIDILHMYMTATNPDGNKLSYYEIISEIIFMLIAGIDTTSVSMTWLFHIYSVYPNVYKKVVDEINLHFPDKNYMITYKDAQDKLEYFVATVYECLRLKPPVNGVLARDSSSEGVQLSNAYIPKNVELLLYTEGAHRNENLWQNPEHFIPERFMGEGKKYIKELFAFSSGVRICPGRNLALMEIFTVMPNILRDYNFKPLPNSRYSPTNLDPSRDYEPYLLRDKTFLTRIPINQGEECVTMVSHKN
ncbi:hypothetical protein BB561_005857 [Smittium simulii]|uniref:Cytochrome P450 n=1 Tax=Smittium simulii TaxID=133385 RepID=A0A2T9Y7Y6_9FUNG|nr:hypothetical protein BB561_005857 [Smittium simulii]